VQLNVDVFVLNLVFREVHDFSWCNNELDEVLNLRKNRETSVHIGVPWYILLFTAKRSALTRLNKRIVNFHCLLSVDYCLFQRQHNTYDQPLLNAGCCKSAFFCPGAWTKTLRYFMTVGKSTQDVRTASTISKHKHFKISEALFITNKVVINLSRDYKTESRFY